MSDYPREIGGGDVREVLPHLYYFDSLEEGLPEHELVIRHVDLLQTASELGYKALNAGRAFRAIYRPVISNARRQGIYTALYTPRRLREAWEYDPNDTSSRNLDRRRHLGISLQMANTVFIGQLGPNQYRYHPDSMPHFQNIIEAHLVDRGALDRQATGHLSKVQ
jgi:hypothetical protein